MALKRVSVAILVGSYVVALADASLLFPSKCGLTSNIESSPKLSLLKKPFCLLKDLLDSVGSCNCLQCQSRPTYHTYDRPPHYDHTSYAWDKPENIHALLTLIQVLHASLAHYSEHAFEKHPVSYVEEKSYEKVVAEPQPSYRSASSPSSQASEPSYKEAESSSSTSSASPYRRSPPEPLPNAKPEPSYGQDSYAPQPSYAAQTSYKTLEPFYKSLEPSYKALEPSYKALEPFYKALEPSYKSLEPSYKSSEPSNKALEPSSPLYRRIPLEPLHNQDSYGQQQTYQARPAPVPRPQY